MSGISIAASSTKLASLTSSNPASGGRAAEHASKEALKALTAAQKKLVQDLANSADKKMLGADKAAVELAAAALARAAAAVAKEKQQLAEQQPGREPDDSGSAKGDAAAVISSAVTLDVYA